MRIKLTKSYWGYKAGTEMDVDLLNANLLINLGVAEALDSHNSALVNGYNKNDKKSVDEAPSDKMVRRGDTRRKSKVK
jgi:hypothetical protein